MRLSQAIDYCFAIWAQVSERPTKSFNSLARQFCCMVSAAVQARRSLVKLLLALASVYSVVVDLNRDSCDSDVQKGFKKVFLKAHPDKGGSEQHAKQLNEAKDSWDKAKKAPHRPKETGSHKAPKAERQEKAEKAEFVDLVDGEEQAKQPYRIQSQGVLLKKQGAASGF